MPTSENSLVTKIRETLNDRLQNGKIVEAIKFYRDVTLTPLLESKQLVESFQADNERPIVDKRFEPFLKFLEDRDFGGAAASLRAEQRSCRKGTVCYFFCHWSSFSRTLFTASLLSHKRASSSLRRCASQNAVVTARMAR